MQTIFIVDDEENIRLLITRYLQNAGYQVEAFASIEELAERMKSGYPDMFILDIMLPGQDGLNSAGKFASTAKYRSFYLGAPAGLIASLAWR